jgi:hypothetical protein
MAASKQIPTTSRVGAYSVLSIPAGGSANLSGQGQVVERVICRGTGGTLNLNWPGNGLSQPLSAGAPFEYNVLGRYNFDGTFNVDCSTVTGGETIVEFVAL